VELEQAEAYLCGLEKKTARNGRRQVPRSPLAKLNHQPYPSILTCLSMEVVFLTVIRTDE
jgi:hypothetical protein